MSDINTIVVIGRLTQDSANINSMSGGAKFCIANNGLGKDKVTFFNCSWFGDRAVKSLSWLKKGRQVCVTGRMECNKFNEKDYWGIRVGDVQPVGIKSDAEPDTVRTKYYEDEEGKRAAELAFEGMKDDDIRKQVEAEFKDASDEFASELSSMFGSDSGSEDDPDVPF